jgi:hypothetical protein
MQLNLRNCRGVVCDLKTLDFKNCTSCLPGKHIPVCSEDAFKIKKIRKTLDRPYPKRHTGLKGKHMPVCSEEAYNRALNRALIEP